MKCVRCSAEIPSQSQFCLRCGTPLNAQSPSGPVMPSSPSRPIMAAPKSNNTPLIAMVTILSLAVLALGAFVVKGMLAQKPVDNAPAGLVQAPRRQQSTPLAEKPAETRPAPVVEKPAEGPPPTPQDVIDYLAFVKGIESEKLDILKKFQGKLLPLLGTAMSIDSEQKQQQLVTDLSGVTREIADNFNTLTTKFQQRTPPRSCYNLYKAYLQHLGNAQKQALATGDAFSDALSSKSKDMSGLTAMMGKDDVDAAMDDANKALSDICTQYNLHQDFKIGDVRQVPGLPGVG